MPINQPPVKNYLPEVRDQYERYPFPVRPPEAEMERLIVSEIDHLTKIDHHCFEGCRDFDKPLRVLIAGGGTGDALIFLAEQLRGKPVDFVFVDMSAASLKVARARATVRGLDNVTWIHGSLLDLDRAELGIFDYINCVGVLHHLKDPAAGLARLESVLSPGGGMGLMLYGKYGRNRVYLLQELLGLIDGENPVLEDRVLVARKTLSGLIRSGVLKADSSTLEVIDDPEASSYLVDTYLHGKDRAYSVSDIHELLASSDLRLAGFTNFFESQGATCALDYDPLLFFGDPEQVARLGGLPPEKRAHIAELLGSSVSMHAFYATRRFVPSAPSVDPELVPCFCTEYARVAVGGILKDQLASVQLRLNCGITRSLDLDGVARHVLERIGGEQSISEILGGLPPALRDEHTDATVCSLVDLLVRLGLVTLRKRGLPALATHPCARTWNGAIDLRPFANIAASAEAIH